MNTDPTPEFREVAPESFKVPALVRFLVAVILILIVIHRDLLPRLLFSIFGAHVMVADVAYRWTGSILLVAGYLFFARVLDQVDENEWAYIGLPRVRSALRQITAGTGIGAMLISLGVAVIAIFGGLEFHHELSGRSLGRFAVVTLLLLGGAMLEELMFRGYPFQRLIESVGAPVAIILLSAFFGAVHLENPNSGGVLSWGFFNTLAVGMLFAVAYLKTKALWLPFGIHFGWNFFLGVVYGLPVSGIKDFSVVIRTTAHGPRLLTGGAYGIEGSLTGSIAIVIGMLVVWFLPKQLVAQDLPRRLPAPKSI